MATKLLHGLMSFQISRASFFFKRRKFLVFFVILQLATYSEGYHVAMLLHLSSYELTLNVYMLVKSEGFLN